MAHPSEPSRFPHGRSLDDLEDKALLKVLHSGKWGRGNGSQVNRFEQEYAQLTGAKHCLAAANGTSALQIALNAIDVQAGDEVVVPPYTFVATINAILSLNALPVFVDTDRRTSRWMQRRSRPRSMTARSPLFRYISAATLPTWTRLPPSEPSERFR